jgi:N-acetylmannosamine-6-phosphate 2-epimerase/N-acetylmannosamine kinase
MDTAESVVAFALAAIASGASALRIESLDYVRRVRAATPVPIIGIVKQDRTDSAVRITPTVELAAALCEAGADIVAVDATRRPRPASVRALIAAIRAKGRLAMADCSDLDDAREALAAGADLIGTTMSGYTGGPVPAGPDLALIAAMRALTPYVVAEGRLNTPALAAEAIRRGAHCVVVGSAITRTEHVTSWFKAAVDDAAAPAPTTLALDIGGTKIAAALVAGAEIRAEITLATDHSAGPDAWLRAVAAQVPEPRAYSRVAIAVSGLVENGRWSSLNPATLSVPGGYGLTAAAETVFGVPATALNDAQAAAWGEHRFGAGEGEDMVFLTISTGIGGGVVLDGRLRRGLAGHFGLWRSRSSGGPLEDEVSGRWLASQATAAGRTLSAKGVFAAAADGEQWARDAIGASARRVAALCADVQLGLDPRRIVIGGGIGLATGFLELVAERLSDLPPRLRPVVVPARLGARAGLVGIADFAQRDAASAA